MSARFSAALLHGGGVLSHTDFHCKRERERVWGGGGWGVSSSESTVYVAHKERLHVCYEELTKLLAVNMAGVACRGLCEFAWMENFLLEKGHTN